jgi:hypothetical protein
MENLNSIGGRINFLKQFLEKNIGINNLTLVKIDPPFLKFKVRKAQFAVKIDELVCYQYEISTGRIIYYCTPTSEIIENWIINSNEVRSRFNDTEY